MAGRPVSIGPQSGLARSHSSILPPSTGGSGPAPRKKGHYRPFSSQSSHLDIATAQSSPSLRRSASVGGLHQFCNNMGLQFGSKGRKELVRPNLSATLPSVPDASSLRPSKKRSMASIFASDPFTRTSSPSPICSDELPIINISKNDVSYEELDTCDKFVPRDVWAKRCNMKLHPYHKQVAYMQAYDPISLESDRYTDLLFQRLTNGSPSFHDYGGNPPAMVLDMGCGQGHWILHAANVWKNAEFVGLDIVDTTLPAFESVENVRLVRGDFVNYKLPFPDDTFDFVRMANLALCIPYDKWQSVLSQVRRILTPGGRLELIDDDIYFPYGEGWKGVDLEAPLVEDERLETGLVGRGAGNNEMRWCEDRGDLISMNPEAPVVAWPVDSRPVTSDLLPKPANPRLAPSLDISRIPDSKPHYERTVQTISPRSSTPGDNRRQWSGFSGSATRHIVPPSPMTRKERKAGKSSSPCPKRTREKVAPLPPIRSITPTFSLLGGSTCSATWNLRTASTSSTRSDTSSIGSTDTGPSTSVGSVDHKVDPENSVWQKKASESKNMESLFEKMLVEQYGIHPRPSEFMLRVFERVFREDGNGEVGEAQVRMTKNFHIKLAPTDTMGDSEGNHVGKERGRGSVEDAGVPSASSQTFSTVDTKPKPQKQTSILVTSFRSRPLQGKDKKLQVDRLRTKKETDKDKKSKSKQEEQDRRQFKLKKTQAGAVKPTATMTSLFKKSQARDPTLSTPVRPALSAKAAGILGIPYSELSSVTLSLGRSSKERRPPAMPLPSSFMSNLSAKAAGRLGITYSELSAATSLSIPPNAHLAVPASPSTFSPTTSSEPVPSSVTSGPVQHTGLIIWPDTYVPMAAGELEMHACKYIHTLLGCRLSLEEFVAKFVDGRGNRFVGEEEFRDEVWEYECFRRARFNWPSEAAEPYEDDPTNPNAAGPSSPVSCTSSDAGSVDTNHSTHSTHSTSITHQSSATDNLEGFSNEKLPWPSNPLLRSPSPKQRSPLPPFLPMEPKIHTSCNLRSASPVPSGSPSSSCSRKVSSAILSQSMGYRKLDDFVHLRSIRVFEGIKAA